MKALILNSGLGRRMGVLASEHPKCMTEMGGWETILNWQLRLLDETGIKDVVMTTGYCHEVLEDYCRSLGLPVCVTCVNNPDYVPRPTISIPSTVPANICGTMTFCSCTGTWSLRRGCWMRS